jgi:hypothetical protein
MYLNVPTLSPAACRREERKPALRIQPRPFYAMLALSCCLLFTVPHSSAQQNNTINTVAGGVPNSSVATQTAIPSPTGIAEDASGNIYIASQYSYYIYKVNPSTGALSIVAGTGIFGFGGDGGPALSASLSSAVGVAVDKTGNVYVLDSNRIRVVNTQSSAIILLGVTIPSGAIATVAGGLQACQNSTQLSTRVSATSVASGPCGDGGPASQATFAGPQALYMDGSGNLFIADTLDERIRFINMGSSPVAVTGQRVPPGVVATLAGNGWICNDPGNACGDGGSAIAPGEQSGVGAKLDLPQGVATDSAGNVYIGDTRDQRIRCVANLAGGCPQTAFPATVVGEIVTYAGAGAPFCTDPTTGCDGSKLGALFHNPAGLWVDNAGNLYVADQWDNKIREVTPGAGGTVGTVCGFGTAGFENGKCAAGVEFYGPLAVILDAAGNLTVADSGNSLIRQGQLSTQVMTTIAGSGLVGDNGPATSASLANPVDAKWDLTGTNYYIVDNGNNRIREVMANGTISTVAGTGHPAQWCTEPPPLDCNGDYGPATLATFDNPNGVAVDGNGNIYIADSSDSAVRLVNMQQTPLVLWSGTPNQITIPPGDIATVAGQMGVECLGKPGCGDGGPATAANVDYPIAVTVDPQGNIYISDYYLSRIRCVVNVAGGCPNTDNPSPAVGTIVSIAGLVGGEGFNKDGINADAAKLLLPYGLGTVNGGLIFDDSGNSEVRCVALVANGCGPNTKFEYIYDYALNRKPGCSGDGGLAINASENVPQGFGFDPAGNLYFGGGGDFVVRRVDASTENIMTVAGTCTGTPGFSGDGGPSTSAQLDNLGLSVSGAEELLIADDGNNRIRQVDMVPVVALPVQKLNFGDVTVGDTSTPQTASMQNYGLATLPISGTVLSDTVDFQIVNGTNTCVTQLPPGPTKGQFKSLCSVNVVFTPQTTGTFNATLTFNTSLGPEVVKLTGVGQ